MPVAAVGALGMLAAGSALASGGHGANAAAVPKARAAVLTSSQRNALSLGYVRVRVRVGTAGRVRVAARVRVGSRRYRVTPLSRFRMRHRGARTVRLRLTSSGLRILGSCRGLSLEAAGRRGGPFQARPLAVRRDPRRCSAGAGSPGGGGSGGGGAGTSPADISAAPGGPPLGALSTADAGRCDFLDPAACLFPWPNDQFTKADASTPTGRRLDLDPASTPANTKNQHIDPTDQNRGDGFSPGNLIVTKVPGLDNQAAFDRSGLVPITDMQRAFDPAQPVVVINARTKQRQLIWAEIDSNPQNPSDVTLIVRPGKNFSEGERYVVALRNLKDEDGTALKPREEFRAYRDGIGTQNPAIEARRAHYESLFKTLGAAGIARRSLYLTWDFTVASEKSLTGRAVAMRDDAFHQLGDDNLADGAEQGTAPTFVQNPDISDSAVDALGSIGTDPVPNPVDFGDVDGRRDYPPCSAGASSACEQGESDTTARRVTGQITVPCYLDQPGCPPGSGFTNGAPSQTPGNTALANVICTIPRQAIDAGAASPKVRPSLYGHGLLGSAGEVGSGNVQAMGQEHGFLFCATDWIGMATSDLPNVATLLQDLSNFHTLVDRIEQGYVNFMYLGRWLLRPDGASASDAFKVDGRSVIDTSELSYDGNSQGGILSGGLTALSPDFTRAVHGVPGMNYSTLLSRSVDFDTYARGEVGTDLPIGLYDSYPNELERPLILSLIQLLWDRGESNGYAQHMTTDPLPNTPEHRVLLHPAFGDHQVANVSAEVEARTIGACTHRPALFAGRSLDVAPLFDIPAFGSPGCNGSGIVYWDTGPLRTENGQSKGTPPAPPTNVPPRAGNDPHGSPRSDPKARQQKSDFLKTGLVSDPCSGGPCYAGDFAGP